MSKEINRFSYLLRLQSLFQRMGQITWTSKQATNRYVAPEAMTDEEVSDLTKLYVALIFDVEQLATDAKKLKEEYDKLE
jgi:hypothetical protein